MNKGVLSICAVVASFAAIMNAIWLFEHGNGIAAYYNVVIATIAAIMIIPVRMRS